MCPWQSDHKRTAPSLGVKRLKLRWGQIQTLRPHLEVVWANCAPHSFGRLSADLAVHLAHLATLLDRQIYVYWFIFTAVKHGSTLFNCCIKCNKTTFVWLKASQRKLVNGHCSVWTLILDSCLFVTDALVTSLSPKAQKPEVTLEITVHFKTPLEKPLFDTVCKNTTFFCYHTIMPKMSFIICGREAWMLGESCQFTSPDRCTHISTGESSGLHFAAAPPPPTRNRKCGCTGVLLHASRSKRVCMLSKLCLCK